MFGINQRRDQNQMNPEHSYTPMVRAAPSENGPPLCPLDNMIRGGMHGDSQWSAGRRANEYPSSSFGMEASHFPPAFSGSPYGPFPQSSAAGSINLAPDNSVGYYNGPIAHEETGLMDSTVGNGRCSFKRKSRVTSGASEGGSTSRFYGAGSSSGASEMLLEKPTLNYQNPGPTGLPQHRGNSLSIAGEDSMRNVRSRSGLDFETNTMRSHHLSSYSSPNYQSTTHPTSHSGMVDLANISADGSTREWNCLHSAVASDTNGLRHETGQFVVVRSAADIGGCQYDSLSSRPPPNLSSQFHHGPPPQTAVQSHNHYAQRTMPAYHAGPSYSHFGHEATPLESGVHSLAENSRYPRPLSATGWRGSNRNGRSRMATERFQSISILVDAQERIGSEGPMVVDETSFYGSRNLLDQYRDMRLDVDGMSYEELLALGESIGNVSTGLSEDMISKCLMEKLHHSQDEEEGKCAICLEEYENKEAIGIITNCGHDYHASCIRKWLSMKNVCPICKTAALAEGSKQE